MNKIIKFIALRMYKSPYRFLFTTLGIKLRILKLALSGFYEITYCDVNLRWEYAKIKYIEYHFSERGYKVKHAFNDLKITWVEQ